eukprot:501668-Hanusia_phi.AAC.2
MHEQVQPRPSSEDLAALVVGSPARLAVYTGRLVRTARGSASELPDAMLSLLSDLILRHRERRPKELDQGPDLLQRPRRLARDDLCLVPRLKRRRSLGLPYLPA